MPKLSPSIKLTRQERWDLALTHRFPKATGRGHRLVLRIARGRIANAKRGIPVGLLIARGARSGRPRAVPLMYFPDGNRFLVVPANAGHERFPAWYHNLRAHPEATFEVRGRSCAVRARIVDGAERDELWPRLVRHNPLWAAFQDLTSRHLPVVALEPR